MNALPDTPDGDRLPPLVVAVDGTSGSGKSSTCRGLARRLGLRYLDTGAQFRAMTWWMLDHGIDVHDHDAVAAQVGEPVLTSGTDPEHPTIDVSGTDVAVDIRGEAVTRSVSPVSAVPAVRATLLDLQRRLIDEALSEGKGIVVEGRDIGSVVWPQAPVKVYLTADDSARAARRSAEEGGTDVAATAAVLAERDRIDSGRATAPLVQADGAAHIDTTTFTLDEVIDQLAALIEQVVERGEA